jgi:hypothetical protein
MEQWRSTSQSSIVASESLFDIEAAINIWEPSTRDNHDHRHAQ